MSQFSVMTMADIELVAVGYHCEVVVAKANQLQFDLDSDEAYEKFQNYYIRLQKRFKELSVEEWKSKNGNRHVVVTLPEYSSVPERIAMQAQGGSDNGREFAALCCHWDGSPHPILLFKPLPKLLMPTTIGA
jgi:hypothetical protein